MTSTRNQSNPDGQEE